MTDLKFNQDYLLSGYGFGDAGPYLIFDDLIGEERLRHQYNLLGQELTVNKHFERRCTGRYSLKSQVNDVCPDNAFLTTKKTNCYNCFIETGFNPAFYNQSLEMLSERQKDYNERAHLVYLAHFSAGKIKVGITTVKRLRKRLLEQGARSGIVLQEFENAYEARDLEEKVNKLFSIPEVIRNREKLIAINEIYDGIKAKKELIQLKEQLVIDLKFEPANNNIYHFDTQYLESKLNLPIFDLTELNCDFISGKFCGLVGNILIMEQDKNQYMVSLSSYISHKISLTQSLKTLPSQSSQMNLF